MSDHGDVLASSLATAASHALAMEPSEALNLVTAFYGRLSVELLEAEADQTAARARRERLAS